MELTNNNLFTELTEEETAALNGGRFCRYFYRIACYYYYGYRYCRYILAYACY